MLRKKGATQEQVILVLTELVLVIAVGLFLWNYVESYKDNTVMDAKYISRDVALVLNTLHTAPGNIYYEYNYSKTPTNNFDFFFSDKLKNIGNYVGVANSKITKGEEGSKDYYVQYPYGGGGLVKNLFIMRNPEVVYFYKTAGEISNHRAKSLNLLNCNRIKTKVDRGKVLINLYYKSNEEKNILNKIKDNFVNSLAIGEYEVIETDANVDIQQGSTEAKTILIISLAEEKDFDYAKSYYLIDGKLNSKLLGCKLLNSFIIEESRLFNMEVANIPKEKGYYADKLPVKVTDEMAVVELNLGVKKSYVEYVSEKPIAAGLKSYE